MAPSVDCVASLYCAEDASGAAWEEDESGIHAQVVAPAVSGFQAAVFLNFPVEDDEAIATLLLKEEQYMPEADYSGRYIARTLNAGARLDAARWMLKVQDFYKFSPVTVALSVNYMDRFLSRQDLPGKAWMLQLLSVACVSLAAKMEESQVPILLDLQVEPLQAVHIFEVQAIQRMELLVLSTLGWRMCSVTPFSYIDYFFHKLGISDGLLRVLMSRVSEIILSTMKEAKFVNYRSSAVAAAAILCALGEVTALQIAEVLRVFASISVDVEAVKQCSNNMQELLLDSYCRRLPLKRKAACKSEPQSPVGVLEAAAMSSCSSESTLGPSSGEGTPCSSARPPKSLCLKRRKLDLNQEDECPDSKTRPCS